MSEKLIAVKKTDLPANITAETRDAFMQGLSELSGSVDCVRRAGACFAKIEDADWKLLRERIPGEARRWAQNARDCVTKGLHPAFALMAGTLGRKARKLSPEDQERILREPIEVAVINADGGLVDKRFKLASELTTDELDRVFRETSETATICTPKEQAARARAKLRITTEAEAAKPVHEIRKAAYTINTKGVTLNRKTLSFGLLKELVADAEKIERMGK
jgi:hypothetical protein